jgi:hypothetical protein
MDFKTLVFNVIASLFIVLQRIIHLILYPYKTMRKISQEQDISQISIIGILVAIYFFIAHEVRAYQYDPILLFAATCVHIILTIFFFYHFSRLFNKQTSFSSFISTIVYTLIPTLIWFYTNLFLYQLIPPPRTMSTMGKAFSIFYISFSISILVWKVILLYLALRFSSRLNFYRIMYMIVLYICVFLPYALLLYAIQMFRIPFI